MTLRLKLIFLVGTLVLTNIIFVVIGQYEVNQLVGEMESVFEDRVVPMNEIKKISGIYTVDIMGIAHEWRSGSSNASEAVQKIEKSLQMADKVWAEYLKTSLTDKERQLSDRTGQTMEKLHPQIEQLKDLLIQEDKPALAHFLDQEIYSRIKPLDEKFKALIALQLEEARKHFKASKSLASTATVLNIILLLFAVIAGGGVSLIILRQLKKQLGDDPAEVSRVVMRIADGILDEPIQSEGLKEKGSVMAGMEHMRQRLNTLVGEVKSNAEHVLTSSKALSSSMVQASASSQQQSESSTHMAASVEQLTESIQQVSQNSDEANQQANQAETLSGKGLASIGKVVEDNGKIVVTAQNATSTVENLGELSGEIRGIVGVIHEVAEQTNLLALNAAIEAARAGEQGRGFAVVADEVRKLAERTSQSTIEITKIVESIFTGIAEAVEGMRHQVTLVTNCAAMSKETGEIIAEVREEVRKVQSSITDIASALHAQSASSTDISGNVEQIARMSEENFGVAQNASSSADELRTIAEQLNQLVSVFRVRI